MCLVCDICVFVDCECVDSVVNMCCCLLDCVFMVVFVFLYFRHLQDLAFCLKWLLYDYTLTCTFLILLLVTFAIRLLLCFSSLV